MALPREHHNGLTTHFLLTITLNWTTCAISATPQWCFHNSKTSHHLCYFVKKNKLRGTCVSKTFRRFCQQQHSDSVRWRWTHRCCHLVIVTLASPFHSQWNCHCINMTLKTSPKLSMLARGLGPSTNVWRISAAWQSTAGSWTSINSAFERSWARAYDALDKMYFNLNNYLTTKMYKCPPGSGTLFFTNDFTENIYILMEVMGILGTLGEIVPAISQN